MKFTLEQLWQFVSANSALVREWGREETIRFLLWNHEQGRACIVGDGTGKMVGVGIARPIMRKEDAAVATRFDPEGSILMIDLLIVGAPGVFQQIVAFARHRWGVRPYICFQREGGPLRVYPSARFFRHFDPVPA